MIQTKAYGWRMSSRRYLAVHKLSIQLIFENILAVCFLEKSSALFLFWVRWAVKIEVDGLGSSEKCGLNVMSLKCEFMDEQISVFEWQKL